jgi:hypothetical protein
LATALAGCAAGDLILIGDCDEIPDPRLVARRPVEHKILGHRMMFAAGYVNRMPWADAPCWNGTRAIAFENLALYRGLSDVRKQPLSELEVIDSGWHLTSLGGAAVVEQKMRSYSHAEFDIPYLRDRGRLEVEYECDDATWIPLDDRFPRPLLDDPRWERFVWREPPTRNRAQTQGLEHAHGCFAYVPPARPAVAVVTARAGAWREVGKARFRDAFLGAFPSVPDLLPLIDRRCCVVIDGLQQQPHGALAALRPTGVEVVAFAENARSYSVFRRALGGLGAFPEGRALGRAEYVDEIGAAGFRIDGADRVFTRSVPIPFAAEKYYGVTIESFGFPELGADALYDFLADAFLFTLAPASRAAA